ncbi:hypothetical protein [Paractinoplanes atraurantiacus]|uniref:hypothetical protein n=1 Tax=Paractinoplanes atraurantiacus TaxID=1036182 RepID=UPI001FEBCABD|nr:hypothetical protein [Actinoplanes atraurantiacus]
MKLLLTDSGVRNASIHAALVELLGKPIAECSALCVPTAGYGGNADPFLPWEFISGRSPDPMTGLGWKSVGILELTALPSIDQELWVSWVRAATSSWSTAVSRSIWAGGCGSPGSPTSWRRCQNWSMWGSAPGAW